jgi:hypothetical protein
VNNETKIIYRRGVTVPFVPLVLVFFCIFLVKDSGFRDKRDKILDKLETDETKI